MNLIRAFLLAEGVAMSWTMRAQAQGRADTAEHQMVVTIDSMVGSRLVVRTRTGHRLYVDALPAMAARRHTVLFVGRVVVAVGTLDRAGVLHAKSLGKVHEPDYPPSWPPDR